MSQVSHATDLVQQLASNDAPEEELAGQLAAQLSHSDGIRGFFVTYLTGEGDTAADFDQVPKPLVSAMSQANLEILVPLACTYCEEEGVQCGFQLMIVYSCELIALVLQ